MGQDWYADVLEFHRKLAPDKIGSLPAVPDAKTRVLRFKLVAEELGELRQAFLANDVPGIADAAADLIYVALGLAISYGIDLRPVWDAVQAANMAKEGGPTRDDGKILKPEGWQPPDVAGILARQFSLSGGSTGGVGVSLGNGCTFALFQGPGTAYIKLDLRLFGNWCKQFIGYKRETFELKPSMAEVLDAASKEIGRPVKIGRTTTEGATLIAHLEAIPHEPAPLPAPPLSTDDLNPKPFGDEVRFLPPPISPYARHAQLVGRAVRKGSPSTRAMVESVIQDEAHEELTALTPPAICGGCDGEEAFAEPEVFSAIDNEVS